MISHAIVASLSAQQVPAPTTDQVAIRAGLTLVIVLIALLLGPRIARSVSNVPALIETARERRAKRLNGANGNGELENGSHENGAENENDSQEGATSTVTTRRSNWLGSVVLVCIWVFALYLIAVVWFADSTVTKQERTGLLEALREIALNLGITVLILIVTLVVARALQASLVTSLHRGRVNRNLVLLAGRVIFTVTVIIGVVAILGVWGLGIALPVTLVGAVTVALSFALQDILKNLVSGVYLLLERPFVIGDRITVATYTGIIENISIRVTALRTIAGERVLVPNGMLFSSAVVNNSFYQRRRIGLLVTAPDDGPDAINTARGKILQTLEGLDYVLPAPAPEVALSKASGGKVELRAVFWLSAADGEEGAGRLSDAMEQVRAHLPESEVAPLDPALMD